jgi:hypothetical protein
LQSHTLLEMMEMNDPAAVEAAMTSEVVVEAAKHPPAKPSPPRKPVSTKSLRGAIVTMERRIEFCRQSREENTAKKRREVEQFLKEADKLEGLVAAMGRLADEIDAGTAPAVVSRINTKAALELLLLYKTEWPAEEHFTDAREWVRRDAEDTRRKYRSVGLESAEEVEAARAILQGWMTVEKSEEELRIERVKQLRRDVAGSRISSFFPTPMSVIERVMRHANVRQGHKTCEPEAGDGRWAEVLANACGPENLVVVEYSYTLRELLLAQGFRLVGSDWMQHEGRYNRIVGNPPFENQQDIDHVLRAYLNLEEEDGRLAMLMSRTPEQYGRVRERINEEKNPLVWEGPEDIIRMHGDRKAAAFHEWFMDVAGDSYEIEGGAFKESGTSVSAAYVVIDR